MPTYSYTYAHPRQSMDGTLVYFEDVTLDVATGEIVAEATTESADRYVIGVNGRTYLHRQAGMAEVGPDGSAVELGSPEGDAALTVRLDLRTLNLGGRAPANAGVLGNGGTWFLYASPFEFDKIVWMAPNATVAQATDYPYRHGWLAGIDAEAHVYQCGLVQGEGGGLECRANRLGSSQALWQMQFEEQAPAVGAALVNGRLYVAALGGQLYALEDGP